ncbi:Cysteine-rich receptor-like protein kinase 19, partial [Dichanthelium oligosanthes]
MIAIVLLILGFVSMAAAQPWQICGTSGNYTANSAYQANLKVLSTVFDTDASVSTSLFSKGSVGAAPDTVYGVALYRGDVNASACHACIAAAFRGAQRLCAFSKDATVFYDTCVLSFSDKDILDMSLASRLNTSAVVDGALILMNITSEPMLAGWDTNNQSTTTNVTSLFKTMLSDTLAQVHFTQKHYTAIQVDADDGSTTVPRLYSMAQCAPDMIEDICYNCLNNFSELAMANFAGRQGGRVLGVRCNLRYDTSKFYAGEPTWTSGSSSSVVPPKHKKPRTRVLVIALVAPLLALFICVLVYFALRRHIKGEMNALEDEALIWGLEGRSSEFTIYDFSQVLEATDNFSEENKLGQGGFGPVYKGRFPDGLEIAVKRLASHSGQGLTEFKNEIQLIAKLQHTNLVRLYGCCYQGQEKILIYEYLPNKSLDFFIFDETRTALIDWNKRLAIIDGIAQGLLYLHKHSRLRVIHRDLKASNILLDHEMNPKISDFGLAKIFSTNDNEGNTKRIVGTYGYMAPEYASVGIFSIKSDVFSFGVLTLEIISGKRTSSFHRHGDFINLLGH